MDRPTAGSRHRRILALAIPAIGTLVAEPLLGAVDTAVAGRLGAEELGALGLAVGALAALTWVFNFLVYGTTASVARAIGAGDREAAGERVVHAAVAALAIGVPVAILVLVGAPVAVRAVGAVDALVDPAVTYLRVRAAGVVFMLLGFVGHGAFRGVSDTRTPLLIVVVANVVNGALDVVLVFGLGLGLAGVAWATVASEVLTVALFALRTSRIGLPLRGRLPTRAQLRALLVVSRDLFLRTGALVAGLLAITAAAARTDVTTAAAHQVIWQVFMIVSFLMDGFAIAAQAMVGTDLGRGDEAEVRATTRVLIAWGAGGGALVALALVALGPWLPQVFTSDEAVLAAISSAWLLASLGHAVNAVVFVLDGVAMGASDFAYLRTWVLVGAVLAAVLAQVGASLGAGLVWYWVCVEILMVIRAVSLLLRVRGTRWLAPA